MADTSSIDFALGERPARTFLRASDSRLTESILQRREFGKSRRALMALEGFSGMIQRCVNKPILDTIIVSIPPRRCNRPPHEIRRSAP